MEHRLSDYCERTVRLSPDHEASRGSYDLTENPFWREILDAMWDREVREITVLKSTRVGGTLALIAAILGLTDLDPGPSMIVTPDETSGIELRDRLYDTALESRTYRDRVPHPRFWNARAIDLQSNNIYLAWAGSAQRLRGRTCRRVFFSEIDVYPPAIRGGGDPIRAGSERVKRSFYSLRYYESSPDGEDSRIYQLYQQGNQMRWFCPCPVCNHFQELRFFPYRTGKLAGKGGVVGHTDENGNLRSVDEAMQNAHYVCEKGCRIDNHQKNEMVCNGVWVPKGCKVSPKTHKVIGKPAKSRRHVSCHLWTIHVPTINFSTLAAGYVDHYVQNDLREFKQNWLGLRWTSARRTEDWHKLGLRLSKNSYHQRGEVPLNAWMLTAGVDVQLDGCYWAVYAWGHMGRCWIIDWGYNRRYLSDVDQLDDENIEDLTYPNVSSDLSQLKQSLLTRRFRMFGGQKSTWGKTDMRLLGVGIDCNYRKNSVHRFVAQIEDARVVAVRGDEHVKPKDRFRKTTVDKTSDGRFYDQAREIYGISTSHYKTDIYDRLKLDASAEQAITFPMDMTTKGADYLRQLMNEELAEKVSPSTNKKTLQFREKNNRLGSHYLDTFVYAYARIEMRLHDLGMTWDSNTWRRNRAVPKPPNLAVREYQM